MCLIPRLLHISFFLKTQKITKVQKATLGKIMFQCPITYFIHTYDLCIIRFLPKRHISGIFDTDFSF